MRPIAVGAVGVRCSRLAAHGLGRRRPGRCLRRLRRGAGAGQPADERQGRAGADHRPGIVVRAAARPADRRARHRRHDRRDGADVSRADPTGGRAAGDAAVAAEPGQRDPPVRRRARRSRPATSSPRCCCWRCRARRAPASCCPSSPARSATGRRCVCASRPTARAAQRGALHHRLQRRRHHRCADLRPRLRVPRRLRRRHRPARAGIRDRLLRHRRLVDVES